MPVLQGTEGILVQCSAVQFLVGASSAFGARKHWLAVAVLVVADLDDSAMNSVRALPPPMFLPASEGKRPFFPVATRRAVLGGSTTAACGGLHSMKM